MTDEVTLGIDFGISRDYSLRINAVRKIDFQGQVISDPKLPFEAYTDSVAALDPGPDNIVGTADDKTIGVWSVPRSHPNFGTDFDHTINAIGKEGEDVYTGYEVTFNKQFGDGWSLMVSYVNSYRKVRINDARHPNELLYGCEGSHAGSPCNFNEWNGSFKMNGIYGLPWGLQYSTSLLGQNENWYDREVLVRNKIRRRVRITVERQFGRLPWVNIWDNRISKTFEIGDRQSIETTFDLYNTMNSNNVLSVRKRHGSRFLEPTSILSPRIFRLGVRYRF